MRVLAWIGACYLIGASLTAWQLGRGMARGLDSYDWRCDGRDIWEAFWTFVVLWPLCLAIPAFYRDPVKLTRPRFSFANRERDRDRFKQILALFAKRLPSCSGRIAYRNTQVEVVLKACDIENVFTADRRQVITRVPAEDDVIGVLLRWLAKRDEASPIPTAIPDVWSLADGIGACRVEVVVRTLLLKGCAEIHCLKCGRVILPAEVRQDDHYDVSTCGSALVTPWSWLCPQGHTLWDFEYALKI